MYSATQKSVITISCIFYIEYSGSQGQICEDFILPSMITNDQYDHFERSSNSQTHLYDTIMYDTVHPPTNNASAFRPNNIQTPYNNNTRPLHYDKLTNGISPPPSSPDDYVEMGECMSYDAYQNQQDQFQFPRYITEPGVGRRNN